jgi:uncharacterized protein YdaU (DUF1376 family)
VKRTPWMPLYCDDLIGSTADMSVEEFGAYVRLLCHCWTRGPLPIDDKVICRIAGCRLQVWRAICPRFSPCTRDDGQPGLSQTRLESERFKRQRFADERAESGRRGAAAKWHGSANGSANGSTMASHNHNQKKTSSVVPTTRARELRQRPMGLACLYRGLQARTMTIRPLATEPSSPSSASEAHREHRDPPMA